MDQEIVSVGSNRRTAGESLLDRKLVDNAASGMSPSQLAANYGLTPEQAITQVKNALAEQDVWTLVERKKLVIHSLMAVKAEFEKYLSVMVTDKAMTSNYLRLLEIVATRLDKEAQFTDEELNKVTASQKRLIISAVETGYYSVRQYLKDYHPDVDLAEIDAEFRRGLQEGFIDAE